MIDIENYMVNVMGAQTVRALHEELGRACALINTEMADVHIAHKSGRELVRDFDGALCLLYADDEPTSNSLWTAAVISIARSRLTDEGELR